MLVDVELKRPWAWTRFSSQSSGVYGGWSILLCQLKQNWSFFLPRKWAMDWVSPEISFWCCASRLQVGFEMITMNLFISRQKWGENMFRVYFISLVTVMTTTSLPSKLSKMLKDHPAWDKRRFVLVRWWKQAKQDFFHTSWGWGPLFPHASIFANLRVSLSP